MTDTNAYWPLPEPDALGPLIGADDVADAVEATLATWAPFYVGALSGRLQAAGKIGGRSQPSAPLHVFGKWTNEGEYRSIGTGTPAAYEVRVTGTVGEPQRQGTGLYIATWRSQVTVTAFGTTWQEARDFTSWYEKIVRWSLMQHKSLGGFAQTTKWVGVAYQLIEHSSSRSLGQVVIGLDVRVPDVLNDTRGPAEVPVPPLVPAQDPTAETITATVTNAGPGGDLQED